MTCAYVCDVQLCLEPICHEPSMLKNSQCDHVACKQCLLSALSVHRHCPVCRSSAAVDGAVDLNDPPPVHVLIARSRLVASLNDSLQVHCPLGVTEKRRPGQEAWRSSQFKVEDGCTAVVPLGELSAHLAECQFCVVPCPFKELGCQHTAPRKGICDHTSQCWFALGARELRRTSEKLSELQAQLDAQEEKLNEAAETIEKQAMNLSRNATSMSVLQEYNSRLVEFATVVARDRVGGDPALFGSLVPPPSPNPERLKAFFHSPLNMFYGSKFYKECTDGTVDITVPSSVGLGRMQQLVSLLPLCPTIKSLAICHSSLLADKTNFAGLARVLPQLFMLRRLHLGAVPPNALCVLGNTLPRLSSLTELILQGTGCSRPMTTAAVITLASGLQQCITLEEFTVCFTRMDTDSFRAISQSLGKLPKLVSVDVDCVITDERKIGDTGWPSFFGSLVGCSSLSRLGIECSLPDVAGPALLSLLRQRSLLTSLTFGACGFRRDNMMSLCKAIESLTKLESLIIVEGYQCQDAGAEAIAAVLPQLGSLVSLGLCSCAIRERGIVALFKAIPLCTSLTDINVENNCGGDGAARVLLEDVLPSCTAAGRELNVDFSHNEISSDMRSRLAECQDHVLTVERDEDADDY